MGRRKERRLAAMAAAGRRVKLDLFLDPSPGEASHNDGIGGENRDQQTVVPTSPSSSDKKENPLALLGQYSDDEEEDEEAANQPTGEAKGSPGDASAQHADTTGDNGVARTEPSASVGDQQEAPQAGDIKNYTQSVTEENTIAPEPTIQEECVKATESVPDSSGMQIVSDVGGNWKAVMHEQSNQCYYWNTVTGETSWDIPNGLASGAATASVPSCWSMFRPMRLRPMWPMYGTISSYPSRVSPKQ